jgi:hypothetical protein
LGNRTDHSFTARATVAEIRSAEVLPQDFLLSKDVVKLYSLWFANSDFFGTRLRWGAQPTS